MQPDAALPSQKLSSTGLDFAGIAVSMYAYKGYCMAKKPVQPEPVGDILRRQRVEVLGMGLRQTAQVLGVAPAHLTDLEKGRRTPSEALLGRIAKVYKLDIAILRAGWQKPDSSVAEAATRDATAAAKVPEFLRSTQGLTSEQWDTLIAHAKKMTDTKGGKR